MTDLDSVDMPAPVGDIPEGHRSGFVAVIGRPNVGKSSLLNQMLQRDRAIVTDIPGTTRDAIDTRFEIDGRKYILIDTAGLKKKNMTRDIAVVAFVIPFKKG